MCNWRCADASLFSFEVELVFLMQSSFPKDSLPLPFSSQEDMNNFSRTSRQESLLL